MQCSTPSPPECSARRKAGRDLNIRAGSDTSPPPGPVRGAGMKPNTTVIGGGLAGLTAATLLARSGRSVTLHEKSQLGGRARTQDEHGALFNQGPHALYRGGRAMQVLKQLGI